MAGAKKLEARVAALETELAAIRAELNRSRTPWWEAIIGSFANDPVYAEAMRLGREYRESTRPKGKSKRKKANGGPRHKPD